jgi:anti-anti-sigma factor
MKTQVKKNGDTLVVSMEGRMNFEIQDAIREDLHQLVADAKKTDQSAAKIVFNLKELEFVGSSGISNFIQTLKEVSDRTEQKPRYCEVSSEFRRVMQALDESKTFEFYDTEERARKSFDQ